MAFFKLRKAAGETAAPAPAPESVDALRRRARYRLAGAAILVLAGVIGFPLLFDNQPRPIAVDIPIEIPDKAKVKPLASDPAAETKPVESAKPMGAAAQPSLASSSAAPSAAASLAVVGTVAAVTALKEAKPSPKEQHEVIISSSKPAAKPADKPADKVAAGRFIVQFGAFTDSAHAHEARLKVEKAGLKTYAQIADTPEGKKFRVRVGPFDKHTDADKAAEKIKKLGLPAAILGL